MRTDTEGLLHVLFTLRTFLRGVVRCYRNHLSASTFSLAFQVLPEHPPGCIGYSESQTMVAYHVGNFQIFNDNGLIAVDVVARGFMERVFALVGNAFMLTGDLLLRFLAPIAPLLALLQFALGVSQLPGAFLCMLRVLNNTPVAIGNKIANTHIQPDRILLLGPPQIPGALKRPFSRQCCASRNWIVFHA